MDRKEIEKYIKKTYDVAPDYPWDSTPSNEVYRHKKNRKWFALVISIHKSKVSISGEGMIDILNIKCDPNLIGSLLMEKGFIPAYHMNKANWISIVLDGSVFEEKIRALIDISYDLTRNN